MNLIGADRKRYAGQLLGLLTSTIALAFFIYAFDLEDLKKIVSQLDPYSVPLAVFWLLAFNSIFALRWYFILNHRLSIASSLYAVFMGIGANMFLPARGGDVLRVPIRIAPVPFPCPYWPEASLWRSYWTWLPLLAWPFWLFFSIPVFVTTFLCNSLCCYLL